MCLQCGHTYMRVQVRLSICVHVCMWGHDHGHVHVCTSVCMHCSWMCDCAFLHVCARRHACSVHTCMFRHECVLQRVRAHVHVFPGGCASPYVSTSPHAWTSSTTVPRGQKMAPPFSASASQAIGPTPSILGGSRYFHVVIFT